MKAVDSAHNTLPINDFTSFCKSLTNPKLTSASADTIKNRNLCGHNTFAHYVLKWRMGPWLAGRRESIVSQIAEKLEIISNESFYTLNKIINLGQIIGCPTHPFDAGLVSCLLANPLR